MVFVGLGWLRVALGGVGGLGWFGDWFWMTLGILDRFWNGLDWFGMVWAGLGWSGVA